MILLIGFDFNSSCSRNILKFFYDLYLRTDTSMFQKKIWWGFKASNNALADYQTSLYLLRATMYPSRTDSQKKIIRYRLPSGPELAKSEVCFKNFLGNLDVQMSLTLLLSYSAQNLRSFYRRIRKKIYYSNFLKWKTVNNDVFIDFHLKNYSFSYWKNRSNRFFFESFCEKT